MITLDFETRGVVDLLKAGATRYAQDASTQVMCLAWKLAEDRDVELWHRAHPAIGVEQSPDPEELFDRIRSGELIEAHNASFERVVWRDTLRREFPQFPEVRPEQWRCSAAKAATFGLPRSLDGLGAVLGLRFRKDAEGHRIMLKLSKPRKARKAELKAMREMLDEDREEMIALGGVVDFDRGLLWQEDAEQLQRLWDYCRQDVRTEHAASACLRDLSPRELAIWQMDQRMNDRGIRCDVRGVHGVLSLIEKASRGLSGELADLTEEEVSKPSSRMKFKAWVQRQGVDLANTQALTVEAAMKLPGLDPRVRRALEICRDGNRTSTAKYRQMLVQASDDDGHLRDMMLYHGAFTGRWAGRLVQPHNFLRGFSKEMEEVWEDILTGDDELIELVWGSVMEVMAKAARGALVADPGRDLIVADFSAIEARDLLWLAGDERALEIFRSGGDIYCDLAEAIYRMPINKRDHPKQRQVGKKGILGLGYGMGREKFYDECVKDGIPQDEETIELIVRAYRDEKYPLVPQLWRDTEAAAIRAVRDRVDVETGKVRYGVRGHFLHCRLPSGRLLSYYKPAVRTRINYRFAAVGEGGKKRTIQVAVSPSQAMPERYALQQALLTARSRGVRLLQSEPPQRFENEQLVYWGLDSTTKQWGLIDTYGGKLVENNTQAVARDQLADAMMRADASEDYDMLLSVHDELVCGVDEGRGDLHEFEHMMAQVEPWADGCPVAAEGWRGKRYRK